MAKLPCLEGSQCDGAARISTLTESHSQTCPRGTSELEDASAADPVCTNSSADWSENPGSTAHEDQETPAVQTGEEGLQRQQGEKKMDNEDKD
ncbi:hypothetical protein NDU88_008124 [Pleurodeles waltl]|uniref:Uncharacterized protein n=1 Tax=Pleurodeles waltl TaxID=8319 RepID=A0AAV7NVK8_PLEWA|nr:hypothetical protein NDU88_008124 [Pleurodeles waltl]